MSAGQAAAAAVEEEGLAVPAQHMKNQKPAERKRMICYAYQLGKCTRADCPYEHHKDPTVVVPETFKQRLLDRNKKKSETNSIACRFYNSPSGCRKGNACTFAHLPKAPAEQASAAIALTSTDAPGDQTPAATAIALSMASVEKKRITRSRSCPSLVHALPAKEISWVLDSGSSYDLISQSVQGKTLSPTFQMPILHTANGRIEPKGMKEVEVTTGALKMQAQGLILEDTPPVLSMGRKCLEQGYGFLWPPHSEPHLMTPNGEIFRLSREGYVPVVNAKMELVSKHEPLQQFMAIPALSSTDCLSGEQPEEEDAGGTEDQEPSMTGLTDISSIQPCQREQLVESQGQSKLETVPEVPLPSHWRLEERLASELQSKSEEEQRRQSLTRAHRLLHYPKNRFCPTCMLSKTAKRPSRRKTKKAFEECTAWGEAVHIDITFISDSSGQSRQPVLTLIDQATGWREAQVITKRDHDHVLGALLQWAGEDRIQRLRSDNGSELVAAGKTLLTHPGHHTLHFLSTPHVHQQNGLAEVNNRNIIEGARALLLQSGLSKPWFPHAIRAYCVIYNVSICDESGHSPWTRRHGHEVRRPDVVPFGSKVLYRPVGKDGKSNSKEEPRLIPGIIVGWRFQPGARWNLQYEVLPLLTLLHRDRPQRVYVRIVTDVVFLREVSFPVSDHTHRGGGVMDLSLPEPAADALTEEEAWEPLSLLGEMEPQLVTDYERLNLLDWDVEEMTPLADEMLLSPEDMAAQAQERQCILDLAETLDDNDIWIPDGGAEGEWHRRDLGPRITRYTLEDGCGPPPEWIRRRRTTNMDGEILEETHFDFPLQWHQVYKPLDSRGELVNTTLYWKRPCAPLPPPPEPPDEAKPERVQPFGRR
eukprot:6461011-Amphidinium_carterae.1